MTYEVIVCEKNSLSEGQIIHCGSLEDCCKYAELHSKSCGISLMVRPKIPTYIFENGQKSDV